MLPVTQIEDLDHESTAKLIIDMFHRIIIHHALWFTEVRHQMGMEKALDTLKTAFDRSYGIQMNRLGKVLGFEMKDTTALDVQGVYLKYGIDLDKLKELNF